MWHKIWVICICLGAQNPLSSVFLKPCNWPEIARLSIYNNAGWYQMLGSCSVGANLPYELYNAHESMIFVSKLHASDLFSYNQWLTNIWQFMFIFHLLSTIKLDGSKCFLNIYIYNQYIIISLFCMLYTNISVSNVINYMSSWCKTILTCLEDFI